MDADPKLKFLEDYQRFYAGLQSSLSWASAFGARTDPDWPYMTAFNPQIFLNVPVSEAKVCEELTDLLADAGRRMSIEDAVINPAFYLLYDTANKHGALLPVAELVTMLKTKDLLTFGQDKSLDKHYNACQQCSAMKDGVASLVQLYELARGKNLTKFPRNERQRLKMYKKAAWLILDCLQDEKLKDAAYKATWHLLDMTSGRHPYAVQLVGKQIVFSIVGGEMALEPAFNYIGHYAQCPQCMRHWGNDWAGAPVLKRVLEARQQQATKQ